MVIKDIVQIGNPILSQTSKPVEDVNAEDVKKVIRDLVDSMRYHELVGMVGSQIGRKLRIFVTEVRRTPTRDPKYIDRLRIYINPQMVWFSKREVIVYEGCGSVAYGQLFGPVKRPKKVIVEALDRKGKKFKLKADDLLARVIQHEYDHLDGIEFTEKITDIRKIMSKEEYLKRIKKVKK